MSQTRPCARQALQTFRKPASWAELVPPVVPTDEPVEVELAVPDVVDPVEEEPPLLVPCPGFAPPVHPGEIAGMAAITTALRRLRNDLMTRGGVRPRREAD